MPFCGFISFGTAHASETAEFSMQRWINATARNVGERKWQRASSRGRFFSYSFVAEPRVAATLDVLHGGMLVGDVAAGWARGSAAQPSAARLLTRKIAQVGVADIPELEFAFGLWSEALERLLLLRCPMGTRALYYTGEARSWLAFASTPEPLLAIPSSTAAIDDAGLAASLILGGVNAVPPDVTLFTNLKRLPAGGVLEFSAAGMSIASVPFWPDAREPSEVYVDHDPAVPRELRRLLESAVKDRSAGRSVIGTLLSGGLDSAAVLGLVHLQQSVSRRLFAYTSHRLSDEGSPNDTLEDSLATSLIDRFRSVTHRSEPITPPERPAYMTPELSERPLPDLVPRIEYGRLMKSAAQDNCDVVFTGWGGDEMASSRTRLHVLGLLGETRFGVAATSVLNAGPSLARNIARGVVYPLLAGIRGRAIWSDQVDEVMQRLFAGRPLQHFLGQIRWHRPGLSVRGLRRTRLAGRGLHVSMELFDWLAQREGLSVVHPLLDRRVLVFCDNMPTEWIGHADASRRAFRIAVSDLLPAAVLERQKSSVPWSRPDQMRWSRYTDYQLRSLSELAASDTWLHGYLDLHFLAEVSARTAGEWQTWRTYYPVWCLGAGALMVARTVSAHRP